MGLGHPERSEGFGLRVSGFSDAQARSSTALRYVQDDKPYARANHDPYQTARLAMKRAVSINASLASPGGRLSNASAAFAT